MGNVNIACDMFIFVHLNNVYVISLFYYLMNNHTSYLFDLSSYVIIFFSNWIITYVVSLDIIILEIFI